MIPYGIGICYAGMRNIPQSWALIGHVGPHMMHVLSHIDGRSRCTLQWRHNGRHGVSNHQPYDCLLHHLFRRRSKKTSKFRITGLCAGNSPWTGEFPAQRASKAENVSIWWRHHDMPVPNLFINFPTYGRVLDGVRPSANTAQNPKLYLISFQFLFIWQ